MRITANITANIISPLSFPNIIGMGPIKITPPVLISVLRILRTIAEQFR
jgi:hypothetical protein